MNRNSKVTLTFGQLKQLVRETVQELDGRANYDRISDELDDATFEEFCNQLDFLVKSNDPKMKALFNTFRKGWKKEYGKVEVELGDVFIRDLHPTQNVIYANKSLAPILNGKWKVNGFEYAVDAFLSEQTPVVEMGDPLVVCEVGGKYYLIDGHHRWSKVYAFNPNAKMKAYSIKNSNNIFKTPDDVLKFAQGTLSALKKTSPINDGQPEQDPNMYNLTQKQLAEIVKANLTKDVLGHIMNAPVTKGYVKNTGDLVAYLGANINTMRSYAPAGVHDRIFMPQYPSKTDPATAVGLIAAESGVITPAQLKSAPNGQKMKATFTLEQLSRLLKETWNSEPRVYAWHCTNTDPEIIKREGWKVSDEGFTEHNMFEDLYEKYLPAVPVFVSRDGTELWDDDAKYAIKLDITDMELFPDFGSLPDFGAHYNPDNESFYWMNEDEIENDELRRYVTDNSPEDLEIYAEDITGEVSFNFLGTACVDGSRLKPENIVEVRVNQES